MAAGEGAAEDPQRAGRDALMGCVGLRRLRARAGMGAAKQVAGRLMLRPAYRWDPHRNVGRSVTRLTPPPNPRVQPRSVVAGPNRVDGE